MISKLKIFLVVALLMGVAFMPASDAIDAVGDGNPALYNVYRGLEEFGVTDAWKMGYTGRGVKVAILDSGIDFATPDLIGAQARVEDRNSPYYGWPIVINNDSLAQYQNNQHNDRYQYAGTSSTDTQGYIVTGTSKSGVYHIGSHPNQHLTAYYKGKQIKVLVVDEKKSGVYNTVYVDLNNNNDFRDDKPCRQGDEISYWDRDGDGFPDESGGMIYFIADGKTTLPFSLMLYGEEAKIPKNGGLVAFHYDYMTHGTMCASTIAAQGKNVKGIAPGAKLISIFMYGGNDMENCLLASLGYDGIANTGDEANIFSRSASLPDINKGTDGLSSFLEYLTTEVFPLTTFVYGNGNFGSGYGTCGSPTSKHVINAGAIYDLWWDNSSYRGDVTCFSSRGPNVLGQVKPNVLATGFYAPQSKPLWITHCGKSAWDMYGGGTSDATPHVSAVVALIYQAYKKTHGEFPTSEMARDILMSSANDINEEVFAQGSGIINAGRAVEIATGSGGALIQPALLITKPVEAGSTLEFNFNISNYYGKPVTLKPQKLLKDSEKRITLEKVNVSILLPVDKRLLDSDLIKAHFYYRRDIQTKSREGYILYLYNWKDLNHDGKFGPDGPITIDEAQEGELETIAIGEWGSGLTSEVRFHDPGERVDDGIVIGLKKTEGTKGKDVNIVIETYNWQKWDNINVSYSDNKVRCRIPTPSETGVYQGKILLEVEGAEAAQCIPVSFATYRKDDIKIENTKEIYENAKLYGKFEGDGTHPFRDARFYPIHHNGNDIVTIDVTWEDPKTDIDVYLYGEGVVDTSKLWKHKTKSPIKLPVLPALIENGHSMRRAASGGEFYRYIRNNREKKITGKLTDGLNIVVLNQVISGGNLYGEKISVKTRHLTCIKEDSIELTAKAGEIVKSKLDNNIDGMVGFSKAISVTEEEREEGFLKFEAEKGDVMLVRSNYRHYSPAIIFDSNGNGILDTGVDEMVFGEYRWSYLNPSYCDVITLPYNGKYFFKLSFEELYLIKERYEKLDESITIEVPEKAGAYLGIAEKDGNLLPIYLTLNVEPREAAQINIEAVKPIVCKQPFDVKLKVCDSFGNQVNVNEVVSVEFEGITKKVGITNGKGTATLTAPEAKGKYGVKVVSTFGSEETYIEATSKSIIEIGKFTVDENGIKVKIKNAGGVATEVNVYANPISYSLPKEVIPLSLTDYKLYYFYDKGYKNGYCPFSANTSVSLSGGEEKEIFMPIPELKIFGEQASKINYIIVLTDPSLDVITYTGNPVRIWVMGATVNAEKVKKLEEIRTTFVKEPLTFSADGLLLLQLNELPPLFFIPSLFEVFSILPDEEGVLKVTTENQDYVIKVVEKEVVEIVKAPVDVKGDAIPPGKIESPAVESINGKVKISWQPSGEKDFDHYNIYKLKAYRLTKLGEVTNTEYEIDLDLWNSYTFRVSAVDEAGNEGELSDPVGIVPTPRRNKMEK